MGADHSLKKVNRVTQIAMVILVDPVLLTMMAMQGRGQNWIHSAGICYLTFTLTKLNKIYYTVTPDLSEVNKDKYEEKVQELANELDKEVPKIGTVKLLMKLTFPGRRSWILEEQPTVPDVLQAFPPLKESLRVSIVFEEMKHVYACTSLAPEGTDVDPQCEKRSRFPQGLAGVTGEDSGIRQVGSSQTTLCEGAIC